MQDAIFLTISGILAVGCIVPYLRDIISGKTKPRVVSWFTWTLLTAIATAAAIADNQWPSAVLTGSITITTTAVVILGLKYGNNQIDKFDIICQIAALIGLVLWILSKNPLVAIIITAAIDFIAGMPTFRHAWEKPYEETRLTFAIAIVSNLFALLAIEEVKISGVIFPIYVLCANILVVSLISFSPHQLKKATR